MRICVFGAGAVGGHLAARLAASGHEVSVVARGAHLEAMRANGVELIHGDEIIRGRVNTQRIGAQDAVLVTLKANMLGAFADGAAPLLGPGTAVVFAQNGIPWWYADRPGEKLKAVVPARNVAGGVVYSANEVVEPGVIRNFVPGNNMLVIGSPDKRDPQRLRDLRAALEKSGMSSSISQVAADPELGELNRRAKAEAAAIASALGVDIARAPLAMARAAGVPTPTLDVLIPLAARKAAAKGLYKP